MKSTPSRLPGVSSLKRGWHWECSPHSCPDGLTFCDPIFPPRRKGSFPHINRYGGRERAIPPQSDQKTRFAGFAVRTRRREPAGRKPRQRWRSQDGGEYGRCEPGCVPGSQVCTPVTRKAVRVENSILAQVCWWFYVERCEIGQRGCPGFGAPYDKGVS